GEPMGRSRLSIDEKVAIVLAGLKGEEPITTLCRRHGISERAFYRWRTQFLEGGKGALRGSGPSKREKALKKENEELKLVVAELTLANRLLKN
ncbi:MAG: transposase, partial [Anaerolineae bacterium]